MKDPFGFSTDWLTTSELREHRLVQKETSRMWRDFWVKLFKRQGRSNTEIAKKMELSESTVRTILKKS